MDVLAGSVDVTTYFNLRLSADGLPATGLTIADLDLQYVRSGDTPVAKVDAVALAAANTAHTDNRAVEIDATDQPGLYRVDWPDAAFATGTREVILTVKHTTTFIEHLRVNLTRVPASLEDFYNAFIQFTRDQANLRDEWLVGWFKNGVPVTAGITTPVLTVVDRANGTVVNGQTPTQVGTSGVYKYDATATSGAGSSNERTVIGEAVIATTTATIDGATRTFRWMMGRDSQ